MAIDTVFLSMALQSGTLFYNYELFSPVIAGTNFSCPFTCQITHSPSTTP
jgi:hypothetical protein